MKVEIEGIEVELNDADALAVLESRIAQLTERVQELEWSTRYQGERLESARDRLRNVEEHTGLRKDNRLLPYPAESELVETGD